MQVLHLVQNKDQSFDGDLNARLEKGSHPEIPCVTSSIDLYGDFFGDTTSWGSHGAKVANGSSNKVSEPQSRPIDKSKAKNIILQSQISTAAQNIAKERRFQNVLAEVLPGAKYGVTPEAETQLNAVEEETESAGKLASINDQDSIADTSEKSYDSAQYQLEVREEVLFVSSVFYFSYLFNEQWPSTIWKLFHWLQLFLGLWVDCVLCSEKVRWETIPFVSICSMTLHISQ